MYQRTIKAPYSPVITLSIEYKKITTQTSIKASRLIKAVDITAEVSGIAYLPNANAITKMIIMVITAHSDSL